MENINKLIIAVEALLFAYGEPMELNKIAKLLKTDKEKIKLAVADLEEALKKEDRGLKLIFSGSPAGERVQLATKSEFSSLLESFVKEEFREQLSPASLEALALISYLGPLSKAQIDYYRGVNSSFILRSLMIRGLIERFLDSQKSNVYLYQASFDLLKYLGISKIEELPEYQKYRQINNLTNQSDSAD